MLLIQGDHSVCDETPVDFKKKFRFGLARPGQARPGQNATFALRSTGGSSQAEWSPCTIFAVNLIKGAHHTPMSPLVKKERMFDLCMEALFFFRSVVIPLYNTGTLSVLLYFVSCLQPRLPDGKI